MFYWPRNSLANLQFLTVWYACLIKLLFIHKGRYNTPSINIMKYQIQNLYWLKFNTKKMEVVLDRYNRNYLYWNSPNYLSQFPHFNTLLFDGISLASMGILKENQISSSFSSVCLLFYNKICFFLSHWTWKIVQWIFEKKDQLTTFNNRQ